MGQLRSGCVLLVSSVLLILESVIFQIFDPSKLSHHFLSEEAMFRTIQEQLKQCRNALRKNLSKRDKWIKDWPGQLCITSSQV